MEEKDTKEILNEPMEERADRLLEPEEEQAPQHLPEEDKETGEKEKDKDKDKEKAKDPEEAPMEHPDYAAELVAMVRSELPEKEKVELLQDYHASDVADALELLDKNERQRLYRLLAATDNASEVFSYLEDAGKFLAELDVEKAADIVENMDADDAIDILEDLDEDQRKGIIAHMDEESRKDIRMILSYDEDQIGSKMTTNYILVRRGMSVKKAMKALVEQAADNDNLSTIYVEEEDTTFYGAIPLQDLIRARNDTSLDEIVVTSYPYVYATESVSDCIEQLKDYSEDSIPVLDESKHMLGVITSQDLVEVVDDELGEDYAKLAGLTAEEDLNEPLKQSLRKRIPWLMILMALGLVVSTVIGVFETVIASLAIVVTFQSLILDMAGNVGTQSLAVTIRVLTDENLTAKQKLHLVFKECRVGLVTGVILGVISLVFVGLYIHFAKGYDWPHAFAVSGCIGLSMVVAMLISSLMGTVIPMFFKKVGVDPAVASGPLITTVNDLVAVVTYYGLAWVLLLNVLHLG